jgi:hypothetical protein
MHVAAVEKVRPSPDLQVMLDGLHRSVSLISAIDGHPSRQQQHVVCDVMRLSPNA